MRKDNCSKILWIRGAGDLATGISVRLRNAGFQVVHSEIEKPTVIRLTVSFAKAVFEQETCVEGHRAECCDTVSDIERILEEGNVPVFTGDETEAVEQLKPFVFIEATIRKAHYQMPRDLVNMTIGLGPGYTAPLNVDAVVETMRGHNLGRVIWSGSTIPNTGIPGEVGGFTKERVIHAEASGVITAICQIGDQVSQGEVIAKIGEVKVLATITGVLRGMIHEGMFVEKGLKIADIDPRCEVSHCYTVSDKARAIGGGVLEAILHGTKVNNRFCKGESD